ncbi:hypothetical protein M407DRAFT_81481, partial [Tulasnella calospora MUT 4182]
DVSKEYRTLGKLNRQVEKAKLTLSSQIFTKLEIESFEDSNDFSETFTRAKFEELNLDLCRKALKPVEQVLKDSGMKKEEIDVVVLVGGSTRLPPSLFRSSLFQVQSLLKDSFNCKEPSEGINPNEAVVWGAGLQGFIISGEKDTVEALLINVCLLTFGIKTTRSVSTKIILYNNV